MTSPDVQADGLASGGISDFQILYQDDNLVAIDKPAGISVHRDKFSAKGMPACLQILRDQLDQEVWPVHRLDSATSGVLLFALSKQVVAATMEQFATRQTKKTYQAIVRGWLRAEILCEIPMQKNSERGGGPENGPTKKMQEAVTSFLPLQYLEMPWKNERFPTSRYTYVLVTPRTGRFHQIRRHGNYLAHPLVGDTKHGDGEHNRIWRVEQQSSRLMLHASALSFLHPLENKVTEIYSPLPDSFARHLVELPWTPSLTT
ncbi:MAG: pseudouridine synthase [Proteobacteria bacterium]|nr:pseudouridine synthase [Pseudomonadota bacterium]